MHKKVKSKVHTQHGKCAFPVLHQQTRTRATPSLPKTTKPVWNSTLQQTLSNSSTVMKSTQLLITKSMEFLCR